MKILSRGAVLVLCCLSLSCARPKDPPQSFFRELNVLIDGGGFRSAVALAENALKQYPRSARLRILLGQAEFELGNFRQAVDALNPALEEGWGGLSVYRTMGVSHFYLGQWREAQRLLEKVVSLEPTDRESLRKLGYLSYYLSEGASAIDYFNRLKKLNRNDLEAELAHDALMALTGLWPASAMVWYTDRGSGIQFCHPGSWEREEKEILSPVGKLSVTAFGGPTETRETLFLPGEALLLVVYQNASHHPLPEILKGSFRKGEETEEGQFYYATRPGATASYAGLPRDPASIARYLSGDSLRNVLPKRELSVRDVTVSAWHGLRGHATYCFGEAVGENAQGTAWVGRSVGIYDSSTDIFGFLVLYGPMEVKRDVEQLSEAIFNLALFGGVPGVPPLPETLIPAEEYQARTRGFQQAGQYGRALTEVKKGLGAYPDHAGLHALLGECEAALGHAEEAVTAYEKARRLGPSDFKLEMDLGFLRQGLGRWDLAEEAFSEALKFKPDASEALAGRGLSSYRRGDLAAAVGYFERAAQAAPQSEMAQYLLEAARAFQQPEASRRVEWFQMAGEKLFFVPSGWKKHEMEAQEKDRYQIFFSGDAIPSEEFDTGMIYVRYDSASSRIGKLREYAKPEEVVDGFLRQTYDHLQDPQKVWQQLSPLFRRGADFYTTAGYAYTQDSRRRALRVLAYYEPVRDRIHVLSFRATGSDLGPWEGFAAACFQTARFGEYGS